MLIFYLLNLLLVVSSKWWSIDSQFHISSGKNVQSLAWAFYEVNTNTTGWSTFSITTSPTYSNELQAQGAGYLEGYLTSELIWMSWNSTVQTMVPNRIIKPEVYDYFRLNWKWMKKTVREKKGDKYWEQVNLIVHQIEGIHKGYTTAIKNSNSSSLSILSLDDIIILNSDGDMGTLVNLFYTEEERNGIAFQYPLNTHCSVLIKLMDDYSDLYCGHTTWGSYATMV
jgi:hypothetical protein